jgi:type II secretory pathway predicted ATPase ExeA
MDSPYSTLEQDPFGADADARYVYLNAPQEELLVALVSAIAAGRTKLLIAGGEGSGKSAFLWKLAEVLYTSCDVAVLGHEMVFPCQRDTSLDMIDSALRQHAILRDDGSENTKTAVLLLDDVDRLDPAVAAGLWRSWPPVNQGWSSMCVVMSTMPQPKNLHGRSEHDAIAAELSFDLPPMAQADVAALIRHRLQVAGLSGLELFTPDALERIAYFSKRVPGRIVQLCQSIFSKVGRDIAVPVSGDIVKDTAYELFLPGHLQKLARGLALPPKPSKAADHPEPQGALQVPGGARRRIMSGAGAADDDRLAAPKAKARDGDDITMPSPPPEPIATAGPAAARSQQHRRQRRKPRIGTRALFVTSAALLLIVATVVAVGVRQGHHRAVSSFEAAVASPDRATGNVGTGLPLDADNRGAAAPPAPSDRGQDSPARSASQAASEAEMMPDAASGRAEEAARARAGTTDGAGSPGLARPVDHSDEPAGAMAAADVDEASRLSRADQGGVGDQSGVGGQSADPTLELVEPRRPPPLTDFSEIARVQSQLNTLGYAAGPVDGIMGPRTRAAIRRYQADAGLPVDGSMSDALIASLRRQPARSNLQNPGRERPRRRIMPAIRGQLDSVKEKQEFQDYCRKNQDSWVFDQGTGKFVFCADVFTRR